jgi:hypothetical protein
MLKASKAFCKILLIKKAAGIDFALGANIHYVIKTALIS